MVWGCQMLLVGGVDQVTEVLEIIYELFKREIYWFVFLAVLLAGLCFGFGFLCGVVFCVDGVPCECLDCGDLDE